MVDFTKHPPGRRFHRAVIVRPWFIYAGAINKGVPVKIMPVGDSITEGKYTEGGYRKPLYQLLRDNGYSVTFVGKEDNGDPANDTGFSTGMENPNREGYGSARIGMLLERGRDGKTHCASEQKRPSQITIPMSF
jgi:hypothetical protein